ncbi:MAG: rhodanese-like domain-containing protein [Aggregatilineales bacterium]
MAIQAESYKKHKKQQPDAQPATRSSSRLWLVAGGVALALALALTALLPGIINAEIEAAKAQSALSSVGPQRLEPAEYMAQFASALHFLLDVRTPEEFASGHLDGATNINVQELQSRLSEIPRDRPVVLYCRSGNRSAQAARMLQAAGFTSVYDLGGIIAWERAGLPVVR